MIFDLFSENIIQALGWTFLHSLWQGALIALLLLLVLRTIKESQSELRYSLSNAGLCLIACSAIGTFFFYWTGSSSIPEQEALANLSETLFLVTEQGASVQSSLGLQQKALLFLEQQLHLICQFWGIGALLFLLRAAGGLAFIQYLKQTGLQHNRPFYDTILSKLNLQFKYNTKVRVLESALVKAPMVIGFFKPIIFFPIGAVNQLTPQQVEAILAHELAHIYRNDYLFNLIQTFVESIFYYHPAVWWISANIRYERETCCDEIAVQATGISPLAYAKTLLNIQQIYQQSPVLAVPFLGQKNQLLYRIQRILNQSQNRFRIMEKIIATALLLMAILGISFEDGAISSQQEIEISSVMEEIPETEMATSIQAANLVQKKSSISNLITIDKKPSIVPLSSENLKGNSLETPNNLHILKMEHDGKATTSNHEDNNLKIKHKSPKLTVNGIPYEEAIKEYKFKKLITKGDITSSRANLAFTEIPMNNQLRDSFPKGVDIEKFITQSLEPFREIMKKQRNLAFDFQPTLEAMERQSLILTDSLGEQIYKKQFEKHLEESKKQLEKIQQFNIDGLNQQIEEFKHFREVPMYLGHENSIQRLERQLIQDGFTKPGQQYKFSLDLDKKRLKINGKKQAIAVFERYQKLMPELSGQFNLTKKAAKIDANHHRHDIFYNGSIDNHYKEHFVPEGNCLKSSNQGFEIVTPKLDYPNNSRILHSNPKDKIQGHKILYYDSNDNRYKERFVPEGSSLTSTNEGIKVIQSKVTPDHNSKILYSDPKDRIIKAIPNTDSSVRIF